MVEQQALIKLVTLARQGHQDSKDQLAREAELKLRAYIYRVTLDYDLTQDLSQEALLDMVKSLGSLNRIERFWPWLYRIAQSKIQQHYRYKQRKAAISASVFYKDFLSQHANRHQDDGLHRLLRKELSKTVMTAIKDVKPQYRAVLSLRCFDQLPYSDIAVTMQCSEVKARVLFCRAKQALKRQLTHRGLSKSLLVMCIGLFGKLTTPAEAASSTVVVTAASTKVGLSTVLISAAGTKVGVVTVAAAAVIGLASVSSVSVLSEPVLPVRNEVKSLHYTVQARSQEPGAPSSFSKGAYEQWFYFPDGVGGPVFMRMQRWDAWQTRELCAWLQNDQANYYYHAGEKQVYINNYRLWLSSLRVRRLPSDTPEFTSFLSRVEGDMNGVKYTRDRETGLLVGAVDYRFVDRPRFRTTYNYNSLDDTQFRYDWPADVTIIDERDQMHVRGWTYFRINGQVHGKTVTGRGQIPFVYDALGEHRPWIVLDIGDDLQIIDCSKGAYSCRIGGPVIAAYPSGTFFKGLARPWMGMHTVDIVRRDAAAQRVWFDTTAATNRSRVNVTLTDKQSNADTNLIYTIDMENDIIEDVKFRVRDSSTGSLQFSYLQDIDQVGNEFIEPTVPEAAHAPTRQSPGVLWLIYLAQGSLDN